MVVYFPPGVYIIRQTLTANKTIGGAFLGHGAATTLKWAGVRNGTMFISAGMTKHRYVGLHWDGNGVAGVGILHQSINYFETEITHEAERFSNFIEVGLAVISAKHAIASAEMLYRNTIFENSKLGVLLNNFNDYDDTFDGCVFRNLAFGLYSRSGISYLRNTRFENSSVCDVNVGVFWAFNSVQRVTSVGSRMFVCEAVQWEEFGAPYLPWAPTFVGPGGVEGPDTSDWWGPGVGAITVRDCHVDSWTGPAAINVSGTLQVHDSTFTNPVMPGAVAVSHLTADDATGKATGRVQNWPVLLSNNTILPNTGEIFNVTSCAKLSASPNATEMLECGGYRYACDPSCGLAKFDCVRNTTGVPCKPSIDMCPALQAGANQTLCPTAGVCKQPPTAQCFCGQCNFRGITNSIRNSSELKFDRRNLSYALPRGKCNATGITASTIFFKEHWPTPGTVFDVGTFLPPACGVAQRPWHLPLTCGAGVTCNPPNRSLPIAKQQYTCGPDFTAPFKPTPTQITAAVQASISAAAAAGKGAVAYFPKGSYALASTIKVSGRDFYIAGCGYQTRMSGGGSCDNSTAFCGPLFEVAAGSHVTFNFMQLFPSNATADLRRLLIHGGGETNVTVNGVQMQGYNENKRAWASGIYVSGFVAGDLLDIIYTDGDITAVGNEGTIIVGFQLAGQVILKPSAKQLREYAARSDRNSNVAKHSRGTFSTLMRFTCCAHDFTTKIAGGQNYVVENLYQESGLNYVHAKGIPGAPAGTVVISAIKTYTTTQEQTVLDNWQGLWWVSGGGINYQPKGGGGPKAVFATINGSAATDAVYLLTQPSSDWPVADAMQFKITNSKATLTKIGNVNTNDTMWWGPAKDEWPVSAVPNAVAGLDAMRRLARIDLEVHHPELGVKDLCHDINAT